MRENAKQVVTEQLKQVLDDPEVGPTVRSNLHDCEYRAASVFTGTGLPILWSMFLGDSLGVHNVSMRIDWRWHCDSDVNICEKWLKRVCQGSDCALYESAAVLRTRRPLNLMSGQPKLY